MTQDECIPSNAQFLQPQSLSQHLHESPLPTAFVSVQSPTTKLTPTKTPKSSPPPPPQPKQPSPLPYWKLFRFADKLDLFLLTIALLAAIANGIIIPLVSVIFGDLINVLGDPTTTDIADEINKVILYLVYSGIAALVCGYLDMSR
jgi:hypothetical protein